MAGQKSLQALNMFIKNQGQDFSGGPMVRNPSANAGDTGLNPGPGRQSN